MLNFKYLIFLSGVINDELILALILNAKNLVLGIWWQLDLSFMRNLKNKDQSLCSLSELFKT